MSQDKDPNQGAKRAAEVARRGPSSRFTSVDEIVAKGQSVLERVRPVVERAVGNLRERFARK